MLKIITISCVIVAISLNLQKVRGFNLLPPIPHIISREPSTNPPIGSDNIPDLKNDASNINFGIEDILQKYLKKVQNANVVCTKLYNEERETVIQMSSAFSFCLRNRNKTLSANANLKKLTDLASDVQRSLTKDVDDMLQRLENSFDITSFLNIINRNLVDTNISEFVRVAISEILSVYPFNLIRLLPDVIRCYEDVAHQFNLEHFYGFFADTGHCIQSIVEIFI
ncbi:uncharacterized protein [Polyergus mexicanus]|uniref:uncharacterized protein n=1 Tax=Polyergus mexicanus TaxID=615972 RepID=UPI0038B46FE1